MESQRVTRTKEKFFADNKQFTEISSSEASSIRGFQNIDEDEEEVWLLQCPKGLNVEELEGQKLKFPGRIKIKDFEAVALETSTPKKLAFGYSQRHKYHVKLLPISGSIVLREKMSGLQSFTEEDFLQWCPPITVEMPEYIKLRHPLLGANFDEYIKSCNRNLGRAGVNSSTKKRKNPNLTEQSPKKLKTVNSEKNKNTESDSLVVSDDLAWIKNL